MDSLGAGQINDVSMCRQRIYPPVGGPRLGRTREAISEPQPIEVQPTAAAATIPRSNSFVFMMGNSNEHLIIIAFAGRTS